MTTEFKDSIGHTYLTSNALPVNTVRALKELLEVLEKNQTNSFHGYDKFTAEDKLHIESVLAFLNSQVFGELYSLDSMDIFAELSSKIN